MVLLRLAVVGLSLAVLGSVPGADRASSVRLEPGHAATTAEPRGRASRGSESVGTPAPRPGTRPLAGKVVVLDPGHQLGNARFPRQINRRVPAGPSRKPCNTTGTATDAGFPEATFAWRVAVAARQRLEALGATVVMTRSSNSRAKWGPCVDARGRLGDRVHADAAVSIHGDGNLSPGARGFHVIRPGWLRGWTDDIEAPSRRLALAARAALQREGFRRATYVGGGTGIDVRTDLGTLNLSDVPIVMLELGNMRHPGEARRMTSRAGQAAYARAVVGGVRTFLRP